MEEVVVEDGINLTTSFATYLIPTAADVPDVRAVVVESGEGLRPFHARGIREPPLGPPAAAPPPAPRALAPAGLDARALLHRGHRAHVRLDARPRQLLRPLACEAPVRARGRARRARPLLAP